MIYYWDNYAIDINIKSQHLDVPWFHHNIAKLMEIKHEKEECNEIYISLMRFYFCSQKSSQQNSESILWTKVGQSVMFCYICVCVSV